MTAGPRVKVEGVREVSRALRTVGAGTKDLSAVNRVIAKRLAPAIGGEASARARNPSGRLGGSMRGRGSVGKASVVSRLVYAPIIEYGWPARRIAPAGFAQAVLDREASGIVEEYEREVARVIERAGLT